MILGMNWFYNPYGIGHALSLQDEMGFIYWGERLRSPMEKLKILGIFY